MRKTLTIGLTFLLLTPLIAREEENKWPDRFEPEGFEIGLFPNDSGGLDFLCDGGFRWTDSLASALDASYSTYSSTYEVDNVEGTANQREMDLAVDPLKLILPLLEGERVSLALEPGVNLRYRDDFLETYGYRTNGDSSITFYRYRANNRRVSGSLFCEVSLVLGRGVFLDLRGGVQPLIFIWEGGSKHYSGLDSPASFTTANLAMGFDLAGYLTLDLDALTGTRAGRLNLHGGFFRQSGSYTAENIIVLNNWKTTIVDTELLVNETITLGGSYDFSFVRRWTEITPSVTVLYVLDRESFGSSLSERSRLKLGLSTKI